MNTIDELICSLLQFLQWIVFPNITIWTASSEKRICKKFYINRFFPIKKKHITSIVCCLLYMMQKLISDIFHWKNYYGPKNLIYNWLISFYVLFDNELLQFGYIFVLANGLVWRWLHHLCGIDTCLFKWNKIFITQSQ